MSEQTETIGQGGSSSSWVLVVLFWTYVSLPLAWGVYRTLLNVTALFTG
ncbi:MFS transporter small subunit [Rubrobacter indicoceani]|nr:oxalate:formate antiporter [Rubrobacter indicoceani]